MSLLSITLVYWPGLYGDFNFDDRPNILDNPRYKFDRLSADVLVQIVGSGDAGTLKRPLPMLSFALNIASTGFDPFYFKLWNLAIHLCNTTLVFLAVGHLLRAFHQRMGRADTDTGLIAVATAALWGLHPLNLTSVLYIVQRMNSLSATFVLLALVFYLLGRQRQIAGNQRGWWFILAGAGGSTLLGLLSKENAVLTPLLLIAVEFTLLRCAAVDSRDRIILKAVSISLPLLAVLMLCTILVFQPGLILEGYIYRDFTVWERLLTQGRAICFYLQMIVVPVNTSLGLFHDDFSISTSLFSPITTAPALAAIAALIAVAVLGVRRMPVLSFGIAWFLLGNLLESTFLPLEMIHEHRNYLPSLGPTFVAAYFLCTVRLSSHTFALRGLLLLFCFAFAVATWSRAYAWGNLVRHAETEVENHAGSERANVQLGRIYFTLYDKERRDSFFNAAEEHFKRATTLSRTQNGGYVGLIRLYSIAGLAPPRNIIEEYIARLASEPGAPSTTTLLQNISDCRMFEYCKLADEDILRMFDALLRNTKVHPSLKAIASLFLAQYLIDHLGDGLSGINVLEQAKKLDPRQMAVRRNLVRLYRLSGQLDRAETELSEARDLDRLREIGPELDQEEIKLREAKSTFGAKGK